jgi:hypothetical protein
VLIYVHTFLQRMGATDCDTICTVTKLMYPWLNYMCRLNPKILWFKNLYTSNYNQAHNYDCHSMFWLSYAGWLRNHVNFMQYLKFIFILSTVTTAQRQPWVQRFFAWVFNLININVTLSWECKCLDRTFICKKKTCKK